jgi:hypothetical protein
MHERHSHNVSKCVKNYLNVLTRHKSYYNVLAMPIDVLTAAIDIERLSEALRLLTRIRLSRPDLWREIVEFANMQKGDKDHAM